MKGLTTILVIVFSVGLAMAQAPQAIPFQGAVRNAKNVLISNKTITVRFSIRNGFSFGNIIYREWQSTVTNTQGLFVLNVGQGNAEIGQFSAINWSDSTKFMQVEIDTTNSKAVWRDIGTQQMLSVPYALNAKKADTAMVSTTALNGVPVGTIIAFGGDTTQIPEGWELCDGRTHGISEVKYTYLFKAIGYNWGTGSNGALFQLPSLGGLFLRGAQNGNGLDPDVASRISIPGSGNQGGDHVGSYQDDAFKSHKHPITLSHEQAGGKDAGGWPATDFNAAVYHSNNQPDGASSNNSGGGNPLHSVGGSETRPINVYVNYIIKY